MHALHITLVESGKTRPIHIN